MFLEINQIRKSFGEGDNRVEVLKGIDLAIEKGEFCVLLGASGSGKSTLLNIIGGIDQHNDFHDPNNDRELIKERLRRRLLTALEECGDYNFVFAPGCALPMDVDRYVFTLMEEVVEEEGLAK